MLVSLLYRFCQAHTQVFWGPEHFIFVDRSFELLTLLIPNSTSPTRRRRRAPPRCGAIGSRRRSVETHRPPQPPSPPSPSPCRCRHHGHRRPGQTPSSRRFIHPLRRRRLHLAAISPSPPLGLLGCPRYLFLRPSEMDNEREKTRKEKSSEQTLESG